MQFHKEQSLRKLNTFGFASVAEFYCEANSLAELREAIEFAKHRNMAIFMLGAGSNIVLQPRVSGLVIKLLIKSVEYQKNTSHTLVLASAGENWHSLVLDTVRRGLYGLENLTLIPGNVGAAPLQNIGAYGVELSDVIESVTATDLFSNEVIKLSNADCEFAYRDSIFKSKYANRFAITEIALSLHNYARTNTSYAALAHALEQKNLSNPTAQEISDTVATIRRSKLPDPDIVGNAGSFFKNPVISNDQLHSLLSDYPSLPHHEVNSSLSKIPAAWLVEQAGWKGHRTGAVGVHAKQAIVLVHYGDGSCSELLDLANQIKRSVQSLFGVELQQEPQNIGDIDKKKSSISL